MKSWKCKKLLLRPESHLASTAFSVRRAVASYLLHRHSRPREQTRYHHKHIEKLCKLTLSVLLESFYPLLPHYKMIFGPIPWGHSGPLCYALSLSLSLSSSSLSSWTSMRRRRATVPVAIPGEWCAAARSGELAQHFSNASCFRIYPLKIYVSLNKITRKQFHSIG